MAYPHKWSPISCKSSAGQRKHIGRIPTLYHWRRYARRDYYHIWHCCQRCFCPEFIGIYRPNNAKLRISLSAYKTRHYATLLHELYRHSTLFNCLCAPTSCLRRLSLYKVVRLIDALIVWAATDNCISGEFNVSRFVVTANNRCRGRSEWTQLPNNDSASPNRPTCAYVWSEMISGCHCR